MTFQEEVRQEINRIPAETIVMKPNTPEGLDISRAEVYALVRRDFVIDKVLAVSEADQKQRKQKLRSILTMVENRPEWNPRLSPTRNYERLQGRLDEIEKILMELLK